MSVFEHYARYYDLLYRDKDYAGEAAFVHRQLTAHGAPVAGLLELGCGTGRHAVEFARLNWTVEGVDLSLGMIGQAQTRSLQLSPEIAKRVRFEAGDARTLRKGKDYGVVVSLFHVMSYHTGNADVAAAMATAANHLPAGGLFLFDFWYGPAVLSDPPVVRVKRLQDERIDVTRIAEPELLSDLNQVIVHYHIVLRDKVTGGYQEIRENHAMRYFFLPELDQWLSGAGMALLKSGAWCSQERLGTNTWYGYVLAKKV